jgi:hypothetical protein
MTSCDKGLKKLKLQAWEQDELIDPGRIGFLVGSYTGIVHKTRIFRRSGI